LAAELRQTTQMRIGSTRGRAFGIPLPPYRLGPATRPLSAPPPWVLAWLSLAMSIRHPVSRTASRAFWPSLPIASESW
jgi:hypothetical protein